MKYKIETKCERCNELNFQEKEVSQEGYTIDIKQIISEIVFCEYLQLGKTNMNLLECIHCNKITIQKFISYEEV